jgi:hypothetical protein
VTPCRCRPRKAAARPRRSVRRTGCSRCPRSAGFLRGTWWRTAGRRSRARCRPGRSARAGLARHHGGCHASRGGHGSRQYIPIERHRSLLSRASRAAVGHPRRRGGGR